MEKSDIGGKAEMITKLDVHLMRKKYGHKQLIRLVFFCFCSGVELYSLKNCFVSCENNIDLHMLYSKVDAC